MIPAAADPFAQDPSGAVESEVLGRVETALASGVELLDWWRAADAAGYPDGVTYPEAFVFNRPQDRSFGFFDTAPLSTGPLPVNGNVQEMFYDEPKSASPAGSRSAEWMNRQVREFILHYFMRISDYRRPQQVTELRPPPPPGLAVFSQCPRGAARLAGFGFSQELFRRPDGTIGRFRPSERDAIIDLRRLGVDFDWIVLRNPIFDFDLRFTPFGADGIQAVLPLSEINYLVTSKDFVIDEQRPAPGVLGRYGFGYAFIRSHAPSPLAYGPGQLEPAFELLVWDVHDDGRVTVRAIFTANQPTAVLSVSIDPVAWALELTAAFTRSSPIQQAIEPFQRFYDSLPGANLRFDPVFPAIRLLDLATFGVSSRRFCISRTQVMKTFLYTHFLQHYQMILGSLQTWRQVRDWTDEADIPEFAQDGYSI